MKIFPPVFLTYLFLSPLTHATPPTPGDCYDIGINYAIYRAAMECKTPFSSAVPIITSECETAAISGCKDTLIEAMELIGESCAIDVGSMSYLQRELFKNQICEEINN